jgi:peroxiredoxin
MAQLGQSREAFQKAGAAVYALSDEDAGAQKQMRERNKVEFITFLSDKQGVAAKKYAGVHPGKTTLQPGTFVIGKDKKIVYAYLNEDYRTRAPTDAVIEAVRKATKGRNR